MRLIDADALGNRMYHESFEKDSDLQRWDGGCWIRYKLFEQVLREMPTIDQQPTHTTPSNTNVPDTNVGDLISRQEAIDALKICDANYDGTNCDKCPLRDERWNGAWYDDEIDCYTKLMRDSSILLELPSVQPRKGKWIDYSDEGYVECPFCHSATNCYGDKDELHYCFSCGAELRGDLS